MFREMEGEVEIEKVGGKQVSMKEREGEGGLD